MTKITIERAITAARRRAAELAREIPAKTDEKTLKSCRSLRLQLLAARARAAGLSYQLAQMA
jgi:hypothetical protein